MFQSVVLFGERIISATIRQRCDQNAMATFSETTEIWKRGKANFTLLALAGVWVKRDGFYRLVSYTIIMAGRVFYQSTECNSFEFNFFSSLARAHQVKCMVEFESCMVLICFARVVWKMSAKLRRSSAIKHRCVWQFAQLFRYRFLIRNAPDVVVIIQGYVFIRCES